jgi:hypothetical protein
MLFSFFVHCTVRMPTFESEASHGLMTVCERQFSDGAQVDTKLCAIVTSILTSQEARYFSVTTPWPVLYNLVDFKRGGLLCYTSDRQHGVRQCMACIVSNLVRSPKPSWRGTCRMRSSQDISLFVKRMAFMLHPVCHVRPQSVCTSRPASCRS